MQSVDVRARIQAHPSREHLHAALAEACGVPTEVLVHESDPPSPWEGYKRCLSNLPDCSHLLVVQDDAMVARNLAPALQQIASDVPVVLFLAGFPQGTAAKARRAWMEGRRYVSLHPSPIVPCVAILWPRAKAAEFMTWADSGVKLMGHPTPRADDGILAQWMKATGQEILVTVPSLVEHPGLEPSTKGAPDLVGSAALYEDDAAKYDWTRP